MEKKLALTVHEAAGLLGISDNKAYDLVATKALPSIRFSERVIRIPRIALEKMLADASQEGSK